MRLLNKNKVNVWCAEQSDPVDLVVDGIYTGNLSYEYSNLRKIKVNLTPTSGRITNDIQGVTVNGDYIFTITSDEITPKTVFYFNQPDVDDMDMYDLYVTSIEKSLNWISVTVKK